MNIPVTVAKRVLQKNGTQYSLGKERARGVYGTVYEVEDKPWVAKVMDYTKNYDDLQLPEFLREVIFYHGLDHDCIPRLIDHGQQKDHAFLILEDKGVPLRDLVQNHFKDGIDYQKKVLTALCGAANGLSYLHSKGIIHADVKDDNILVRPDDIGVLIDLGLALHRNYELLKSRIKSLLPEQYQEEALDLPDDIDIVGTLHYIAPEALNGVRETTTASDVYSLGITLVYTLNGRRPYPDHNFVILRLKKTQDLPALNTMRSRTGLSPIPKKLEDLTSACLDRKPGNRPTAGNVAEVLASLIHS